MPNTDGPFDLNRFVDAQARVYDRVVTELRGGRKASHWMWFIFPQLRGLGHSEMAIRFAISSREEALAYLDNPILGARLIECTQLVTQIQGRSIDEIFGYPDDLKFHSSMTLFSAVASQRVFRDALQKYFEGKGDSFTLAHLDS